MPDPLLSIRNLCVDYVTPEGIVRAVDEVSFDLQRGEILGLAGESGSGKSTLAQALLRILPPPGIISGGQVMFEGQDLLELDEAALRRLRWSRISMVFQSAMDALNPVITIGEQLTDTMRAHRDPPARVLNPALTVGEQLTDTIEAHAHASARSVRARALELLDMVEIPRDRLHAFAHQLSGGMRQRVGIALALALDPALVILDEPTTALDVVVEHGILTRIRALQRERGFAVLFITHDIPRMLQFSDRVAVLYAARLAEVGPAATLAQAPRHPYTQGLLRAFPAVTRAPIEMATIPGSPPSLRHPPEGCRFHPRCAQAMPACRAGTPPLVQIGPGHAAACRLLG